MHMIPSSTRVLDCCTQFLHLSPTNPTLFSHSGKYRTPARIDIDKYGIEPSFSAAPTPKQADKVRLSGSGVSEDMSHLAPCYYVGSDALANSLNATKHALPAAGAGCMPAEVKMKPRTLISSTMAVPSHQ